MQTLGLLPAETDPAGGSVTQQLPCSIQRTQSANGQLCLYWLQTLGLLPAEPDPALVAQLLSNCPAQSKECKQQLDECKEQSDDRVCVACRLWNCYQQKQTLHWWLTC